jgi:hypothetical protein
LFSRHCLEDSPSLQPRNAFLATLSDGQLLHGLRRGLRPRPPQLARARALGHGAVGRDPAAWRFRAFAGVVMVVHACFATLLAKAPRQGTLGTLHLGLVQKALAAAEAAAKQPRAATPARAGA